MEREGDVRELYRRLERAWNGLELPPPSPVPEGFAPRVQEAARRLRAGELSWSLAPRWARAAGAAALAAGLALGTALGAGLAEPATADDPEVVAFAEPLSLAEGYWLHLEEGAGAVLGEDQAEGAR